MLLPRAPSDTRGCGASPAPSDTPPPVRQRGGRRRRRRAARRAARAALRGDGAEVRGARGANARAAVQAAHAHALDEQFVPTSCTSLIVGTLNRTIEEEAAANASAGRARAKYAGEVADDKLHGVGSLRWRGWAATSAGRRRPLRRRRRAAPRRGHVRRRFVNGAFEGRRSEWRLPPPHDGASRARRRRRGQGALRCPSRRRPAASRGLGDLKWARRTATGGEKRDDARHAEAPGRADALVIGRRPFPSTRRTSTSGRPCAAR